MPFSISLHAACDGVCSEHKETYLDYARRTHLAGGSGVVPAEWFLSHSWGTAFHDTIDTVLPSADDCFVAMLTPPTPKLWPLYVLVISAVPLMGWGLLLILGSRRKVLQHMAKPRWWTPRAVTAMANNAFWIDILCKNQHKLIESGDTASELSHCLRACGKTALACTPWQSPACLLRIWCQFEIHHTHLAGTRLKAAFSNREKNRMDQTMYGWKSLVHWMFGLCGGGLCPENWADNDTGSQILGCMLARLKVEDAQATVEADRAMILSKIAGDFGGDEANHDLGSAANKKALTKCDLMIRTAIIDSIEEALGSANKTAAKAGGRRPRQIPLRLRVAFYTLMLQVFVVLGILVHFGTVPASVLIYAAVFVGLFMGITLFNMAAKAHQMLTILSNADMGQEKRARAFRLERSAYLLLTLLSLVSMLVLFSLQLAGSLL